MATEEQTPVELHIVSDSTGETAARLVLALEAQFPEQVFSEIRHPRVESVDDLIVGVNAAVVEALADPKSKERFAAVGHVIPPRADLTPEKLAAYHKAEIDKWWPIIRAAGIKAPGN